MTRTPILLDEDLVRAAEILEETAGEIKRSNAVGDRQWIGDPDLVKKDLADHDEMLRIARRFRRVVGTLCPAPSASSCRAARAGACRLIPSASRGPAAGVTNGSFGMMMDSGRLRTFPSTTLSPTSGRESFWPSACTGNGLEN